MRAQLFAVEPDGGVHVDALEFHGDALAGPVLRRVEAAPVPAHTGGEEPFGAAAGVLGVGRALDAPVVREGDGAPGGIVEGGGLRVGGVGQEEFPAGVE